jgi:hypothetical protein
MFYTYLPVNIPPIFLKKYHIRCTLMTSPDQKQNYAGTGNKPNSEILNTIGTNESKCHAALGTAEKT